MIKLSNRIQKTPEVSYALDRRHLATWLTLSRGMKFTRKHNPNCIIREVPDCHSAGLQTIGCAFTYSKAPVGLLYLVQAVDKA